MLISNPMRFGTDIFGETITISGGSTTVDPGGSSATGGEQSDEEIILTKAARLESNQPIDCSNVSAVTGFNITGVRPADSECRFLFKVDGQLYKFFNGTLGTYAGQGALNNILKWGNTVEQLNAITSVPEFVGKQVYPVIALQAPVDSDFPTVKFGIKTTTSSDTLSKWVFSAPYALNGNDPKVIDINTQTTVEGQGQIFVNCSLYNNGTYSDWLTLNNAVNQSATRIKFRTLLKVANVGEDSAQLNSIALRYSPGGGIVSGDTAEIFTQQVDFKVPLSIAYLVVRHKRLIDSVIDASIAFLPTPKHREHVQIGIANGSRQSFTLNDSQIDQSSIQVFVDGESTDAYEYNCLVNEITLIAPKNAVVNASYDYDCGVENWEPMIRDGDQQPYDGVETYMSRFSYSGNVEDCSKAVVRIKLIKPTGSVSNVSLGKATGYNQYAVLPHRFVASTLRLPSGVSFDYDDDNQILSFNATKNKTVTYSGSWVGESHEIISFAAGFAL